MSSTGRLLRIAPLCLSWTEFERCVELQLAVWQYDAADLIPRRMFLLAKKIGGQVFGAFDDEADGVIVAFAMSLVGLPGWAALSALAHAGRAAGISQPGDWQEIEAGAAR